MGDSNGQLDLVCKENRIFPHDKKVNSTEVDSSLENVVFGPDSENVKECTEKSPLRGFGDAIDPLELSELERTII